MLKTIAAAVLALCACACASRHISHGNFDPTIETNQTYDDGEYK